MIFKIIYLQTRAHKRVSRLHSLLHSHDIHILYTYTRIYDDDLDNMHIFLKHETQITIEFTITKICTTMCTIFQIMEKEITWIFQTSYMNRISSVI